MKTGKLLATAILSAALLMSCSDDDDIPEEVHEEEVITTLIATLTPQGQGTEITLESQDLDGDGPNDPVVTVSGPLAAGVVYDGSIKLWNETEDPAEDITEEVEEEDLEHQFFYTVGSGLDVSVAYG